MQKNLTAFFGKVAAVSPLVGSNLVQDITLRADNLKEDDGVSASIEVTSSLVDIAKHDKSFQDKSNMSIVTPSSSAEKDTCNHDATAEDSYRVEFDRLQDSSSSPQQDSPVLSLIENDQVIIIDDCPPEDKICMSQSIDQTNNKKSVVAVRSSNKKPRAPRPKNTSSVKRKSPIKQKEGALEGIAIASPSHMEAANLEVADGNNPIINLPEVETFPVEPEKKGTDTAAKEEKNVTSETFQQPKKRKSKKPDMYDDANYVKPKRVRNKKSETGTVTANASDSIAPLSHSSSSVKAPSANKITGFMTESISAGSEMSTTIVPFSAEQVPTQPVPQKMPLLAPVIAPKPLPEYSPEIVAKIQLFKEKALALCHELAALESCSDLHDNMIDVEAAQDDLIRFCKTSSAIETAVVGATSADEVTVKGAELAPVSSQAVASEEEMAVVIEGNGKAEDGEAVEEKNVSSSVPVSSTLATTTALVVDTNTVQWKCKAIIARCMQGSPTRLSQSMSAVRASLAASLEALASVSASFPADDESKYAEAQTCLSQLLASEEMLSEFVKEVAGRELYGYRQRSGGAAVAVNEDDDPVAIYRWEVHNCALYLSSSGQTATKELRTVRKRYGKAVRATFRVIEQLQSMRGVATETESNKSKVATLEDGLAKSVAEIEKAKGRRLELLKKRAVEAEEKARKEEAREAKKREKEEKAAAAAAAAQEKEKEKEKEKDKKKSSIAVEKEKKQPVAPSSNPLLKFFVLGKEKPSVATSPSDGSRETKVHTGTSSSPNSSSVENAASSSTSAVAHEAAVVDLFAEEELFEQRRKQFNDSIAGTLDMAEILIRNKEWARKAHQKHRISQAEWKQKTNKQPRQLTSITVSLTVASNDFGGDDDNNYCEIRDVFVDNKIRTLSFCEDHRPAYVGTWSKRSRFITGRRPFGKDDELLNYDYDSEAEWEEEEDDGEDIMESDEEDKKDKGGEDSELEYDDMFCKDDDFGSDVDSDGGEIAAAVKNVVGVGHRIGEDICGPKFLRIKVGTNSSGEDSDRQREIQIYFRTPQVSLLDSAEDEEVLDGYYKDTVKDSDVTKLSKFSTVVFASPDAMPFLGDHKKNHIPKGGTSTKKKKKKATEEVEIGKGEGGELPKESSAEGKNATAKMTESDVVALLHYLHGKKDGLEKLVTGFHELHPAVSKAAIKRKIQEAAHRQKREDGSCSSKWTVNQDFLVKASLTSVELPVVEMSPVKKKKRKISECTADGKGRSKEPKKAVESTSSSSAIQLTAKSSHPFAQSSSNPSTSTADASSSTVSLTNDEKEEGAQHKTLSAAASLRAEAMDTTVSENNVVDADTVGKVQAELLPSNHPPIAVVTGTLIKQSGQHSGAAGSHPRVVEVARGKSKAKSSPLAVKKAKTSANCRKITDFTSMKAKQTSNRLADSMIQVVDLSGDTDEKETKVPSPFSEAANGLARTCSPPATPNALSELQPAEVAPNASGIAQGSGDIEILSGNSLVPVEAAAPAVALTHSSDLSESAVTTEDGTIERGQP